MKGSSWVGPHNNHRSSTNNHDESSINLLSHKISSPILSNSQDQQIYIPSGQFKDIATASISLKSPRSNSNSPTSMRHMLSPRHLTKFSRTSSPNASNNPKISSPLSPSSPYDSNFQSPQTHDQQLVAYNPSDRSLVVSSPLSSTNTNLSSGTLKKKKKKKKRVKPIVTFESHNDSPSPRIDPYQIARMEMSKKLKQNQNIKEKIQTINNIDNSTIMAEEQEIELEQLQREQVQQQQLQKLHQIQQQHQIEQEQQQLEHQRLLKEQEQRKLQAQQQQALRNNFVQGYSQLSNNNENYLANMSNPERIYKHADNNQESSNKLNIRKNTISATGIPFTQEQGTKQDKLMYSRQASRRKKYQISINEETIMEGQEYDFNVREKNDNFEENERSNDQNVNTMVDDFNLSNTSPNDDRRLSSFSLSSSNTISTIAESALHEHNIPIFFAKKNKETDESPPLNIEHENRNKMVKGHFKNEQSVSSVMLEQNHQFSDVVVEQIPSSEQSSSHLLSNSNSNQQKTIQLSSTKNLSSNPTNLQTYVVNPFTYQVGNPQTNNHLSNNDIETNKFLKSPPQTSYQKDLSLQVSAQAPIRLVSDPDTYKTNKTLFEADHAKNDSNEVLKKENSNTNPDNSNSLPQVDIQYDLPVQVEIVKEVSNDESSKLESKLNPTDQNSRESGIKSSLARESTVHESLDPQTAKSEYFPLDIHIGDKFERQSPEIQSSYLNFREKSKFMSPAEKFLIQKTIHNVPDSNSKNSNSQSTQNDSIVNTTQPSYSEQQERSITSFSNIVSPTSPLFKNGRTSNFPESSTPNTTDGTINNLRNNFKEPTRSHTIDRSLTYKRRNNSPKIPGRVPYPINDETVVTEHEITEITPVQASKIQENKDNISQLQMDPKKVNGNSNNTGLFVFSVNFNESQLSLTDDPTIKTRSKSQDVDTESSKSDSTIKNASKAKPFKSKGSLANNTYETNNVSGDIIISASDTYSESGNAEEEKAFSAPIKPSKSYRKMSFLSDASNSAIDLPDLKDKIKNHERDNIIRNENTQKKGKKVYKQFNIIEKTKQRNFLIDVTDIDNVFVFDELGIFDEIEITGVSDVEASLKIKKPMSNTFTVFIDISNLHPAKTISKGKINASDELSIQNARTVQISKITGFSLPFETEYFPIKERNKNRPKYITNNRNTDAVTQLEREKTEVFLSTESSTLRNADAKPRYSTTSSRYENDEDDQSASKHLSKLSIASSVYE